MKTSLSNDDGGGLRLAVIATVLLLSGALAGCGGDRVDDWSRHDAYRRCSAAIAAYPEEPAPPCQAMHLCANEARLTAAEQVRLRGMIRATQGCPDP